MKTLPNLTAIRFFLALFVVIYHIPQFCRNQGLPFFDDLPVFHKGTEAVYVFFALSGFLIIRQLYIEKTETNTISLKRFYWKRILRIFPLYYLVLLLGLLYYQLILPNLGYTVSNDYNLLEGVLLAVFFLPNVFNVLYKPGGILEILWSIGIEEQFYLFIAPLILVIDKKYFLKVLLGFTVIYFLLFFADFIPQLAEFGMYFFYFSAGGLFSVLTYKNQFRLRHQKTLAIALTVVFILYFTTNLFKDTLTGMGYHLFGMILFSLFLSALSLVPFACFENRIMRYLGTISYGIYMFHAIAMQLVGYIFIRFVLKSDIPESIQIISFFGLVIFCTILVSGLSYKYYESHFLKLKYRSNKKQNH